MSVSLVLLITVLWVGCLSPPGGWLTSASPYATQYWRRREASLFFFFSTLGLVVGLLGMIGIALYYLLPIHEGLSLRCV